MQLNRHPASRPWRRTCAQHVLDLFESRSAWRSVGSAISFGKRFAVPCSTIIKHGTAFAGRYRLVSVH